MCALQYTPKHGLQARNRIINSYHNYNIVFWHTFRLLVTLY